MFDKTNGPIRRTAVILTGSTTCDIALGDEGTWNDGTQLKFRKADGTDTVIGGQKTVTLTNAQVKALRATPITLVPAPGAGKVLRLVEATLVFHRVAAYTESADNLGIKYVDGSGTQASADIETTGFLDAAGDAVTFAVPHVAEPILTAAGELSNAPLVLHNTGDGEYGAGNASNTLKVIVTYRVYATGL